MPWGAVAGAVIAGGASMAGSNSASKKQKGAADAATALQEGIYHGTVQRNEPFVNAGTDALSQLQQRLQELTSGYDPSKLTADKGYQFGLNQGQTQLDRMLQARGLGGSGAALKAATEYGNNYATTKLGEAFQRDQATKTNAYNQLMGIAQLGQASANQTAAAGAQFGSSAGSNMIGAGNAGAAADIASANGWGNAINQGISTYMRNRGTGVSSAPGWSTAGGGSGMWDYGTSGGDGTALLEEGGPVPMPRREPKIGTKGPRASGGTGGGMSREAILAAIEGVDQSASGAAPAAGQLRVDPTNPRAVQAERERKAGIGYQKGGAIPSAGAGGRNDTVPVKAAGGEHMIDAEVVAMLGDGDTAAGHKVLEELKAAVRATKRAAPADRPAPALRLAEG